MKMLLSSVWAPTSGPNHSPKVPSFDVTRGIGVQRVSLERTQIPSLLQHILLFSVRNVRLELEGPVSPRPVLSSGAGTLK